MATPTQYAELVALARAKRQLPRPSDRRRIREDAGLSLRAVAAALGVSHMAVAGWERGGTPRQHRAAYAQLLRELEQATSEEPAA